MVHGPRIDHAASVDRAVLAVGLYGKGVKTAVPIGGLAGPEPNPNGSQGMGPRKQAPPPWDFRDPQGGPVKWEVSTGMDRRIFGNWEGNFDWGSVMNRKSAGEIALAVPGEPR